MLPSFHDDYLVGYEVDCEAREIKLHIKPATWATQQNGSTVLFNGVEAYHFENDAFGNIIFDLEVVATATFVSEYRGELAESFRMCGAPSTWVSDPDEASRLLSEKGIQAFVLLSSLGLSGWVLAKEASVVPRNSVRSTS
jgi:hypothetical protein